MTTHLVDADVTIDYLNQRPDALSSLNSIVSQGSLGTSIIVVGEVREGFVGHPSALANYDEFLASVQVLGIDDDTATRYAELRSSLRRAGQLISDNDVWIAATALRHGLTLISRDKAFQRIPNSKLLR